MNGIDPRIMEMRRCLQLFTEQARMVEGESNPNLFPKLQAELELSLPLLSEAIQAANSLQQKYGNPPH